MEASEAGVTLAKYEYDALGRRIISWLDDEWRTVSLWSGNDSIYEIRQEWTTPPPNPPAETITRYIAVNGQYLAKLVSGPNAMQPFFHHTDIVGTVRAVTDISGAVVARYAYEPFGSLTTASGLVDGELHRFTGKPSDLETSLSYFNARYYDPALGRFTSSDPARDGLNWYQYCNGNPIIFKDNDGKKKIFVVEPSPIGTKAHRAIEKEFLSWYGEGSVQYEETCGSGIFDVAIKSDEVWHLYEIKPLRYTLGYRHKDMQNQIGRYVLALAGRDNQYILGNCLSSNSEMKEKIKTIKSTNINKGHI